MSLSHTHSKKRSWRSEPRVSSVNLTLHGIFQWLPMTWDAIALSLLAPFCPIKDAKRRCYSVSRCKWACLKLNLHIIFYDVWSRLWWYVVLLTARDIWFQLRSSTPWPGFCTPFLHTQQFWPRSLQNKARLAYVCLLVCVPCIVHGGAVLLLLPPTFPSDDKWDQGPWITEWQDQSERKYYSHNNAFLISSDSITAGSIKAAWTFGTKSQSVLSGTGKL